MHGTTCARPPSTLSPLVCFDHAERNNSAAVVVRLA